MGYGETYHPPIYNHYYESKLSFFRLYYVCSGYTIYDVNNNPIGFGGDYPLNELTLEQSSSLFCSNPESATYSQHHIDYLDPWSVYIKWDNDWNIIEKREEEGEEPDYFYPGAVYMMSVHFGHFCEVSK